MLLEMEPLVSVSTGVFILVPFVSDYIVVYDIKHISLKLIFIYSSSVMSNTNQRGHIIQNYEQFEYQ